jgi:hypothetical protein
MLLTGLGYVVNLFKMLLTGLGYVVNLFKMLLKFLTLSGWKLKNSSWIPEADVSEGFIAFFDIFD